MKLLATFAKIAARLAPSRRGSQTVIEALQSAVAEKEQQLEQQAIALAHSRKIFDRSSEAARIGVWECSLPDNRLVWTKMVYDLFDVPYEADLDRAEILKCYSKESLAELVRLRSRAIQEQSGFTLDAEIVTPKGNTRWIRITATVECEGDVPARIFGMKLDITAEKMMFDQIRYLAEFDILTGLPNRAQFQTALQRLPLRCISGSSAALLLIDLDGFKGINDTFGHQAGDECLKETAERLLSACKGADLVARIGGDEFAVLVSGYDSAESVAKLAETVVHCLTHSVERDGARMHVGASVGVAFFDASMNSNIFVCADAALYKAKTDGKNRFQVHEAPACIDNPEMDAA
ncbi:GGDEF domain-containing protein [Rhizobium sp. T1470]|uniref:GGDEF domain-containing protein n=1 Tax=unclassified Rhizobium TaxID=2613769 RepID=UPI001AAF425E|nr:GGDEF domain-containing protein [Rhizobium sp. T1473]MCA0802159.1 GGDEF domain-containing protein [Rhizobium sp. T1473]